MKRALVVIARRPTPGQTKTRLTPSLSIDQASELYECFLKDTLDIARAVAGVTRLIAYTPHEEAGYFERLAPDFGRVPQVGDNLGERLDNALAYCLNAGFDQVVIMGSDSPTLPSSYIVGAFNSLDTADVVLGPTDDGGYYLISEAHRHPRLLREVQMSTPNVLRDTLVLAEADGLRVALLPAWYDVDTFADLHRLADELGAGSSCSAHYTAEFLDRELTVLD